MDSCSELLAHLPRGFWSGNLAIGAGLAADAVIATFGVAASIRRRWGRWLYWTLGVSFTHWLFPMIGFSVGWVVREHRGIVRGVYLVGALLLWHHLRRNVVHKAMEERAVEPGPVGSYAELSLVILAVSLDALLSGPAQSVIAEQWTGEQLALSFAVVALAVFVLLGASALACIAILELARGRTRAAARLGLTSFIAGSWTVEVVVFTGFAALSFGRALFLTDTGVLAPVAAAVGLAAAAFLWLRHAPRIRAYCRGIAASLLAS